MVLGESAARNGVANKTPVGVLERIRVTDELAIAHLVG